MSALHATLKLKTALKLGALPARTDLPPAAAVLGDWSLILVHARSGHLVVAVSHRIRWVFALAAAPLSSLRERFAPALLQELVCLGVPVDRARAEVDAMAPLAWAGGHDRGALSQLNMCARDVLWAAGQGLSLPSINRRLSERSTLKPVSGFPGALLLKALGGDPARLHETWKTEGKNWQATWDAMQAQAGRECVTLAVAELLHLSRLEARYQATSLLDRLPHHPTRQLASGAPLRWIPRELLLDLTDIESMSTLFANTLLAEVQALGVAQLSIANAEPEVVAVLQAANHKDPS